MRVKTRRFSFECENAVCKLVAILSLTQYVKEIRLDRQEIRKRDRLKSIQNGRHFADEIFMFMCMTIVIFFFQISPQFCPICPVCNAPTLAQMMFLALIRLKAIV